MSPIERAHRAAKRYGRNTFSSLRLRNYRLYFIGQAISLCGTWMQMIAQSWLVLKLSGSGTALGAVTALQFLPILVLAPYGGVIADRFPKRRLLFITQFSAAILALVLGVLVVTNTIQLWMVFALAALTGLVNSLDNPTRQSFVHELAGREELGNAVTLNSIEINMTRAVGPAFAALIIAAVGLGVCFLLNAASFLAVLVCLYLMNHEELHSVDPVKRAKGQLREGFEYVWRTRLVRNVLIIMAVVGTLTYEFSVTLPLLARFTFDGGVGALGALTTAMGVGAVAGGLATAHKKKATLPQLVWASLGFAASTALLALSPTLTFALAALLAVGVFSIRFTALCNTILQLNSDPKMRSRVMSLWSVAFLGSTFVGGPVIGWIGEHAGPRWSLGLGAFAALAAAGIGVTAAVRSRERLASEAEPVTIHASAGALMRREEAEARA